MPPQAQRDDAAIAARFGGVPATANVSLTIRNDEPPAVDPAALAAQFGGVAVAPGDQSGVLVGGLPIDVYNETQQDAPPAVEDPDPNTVGTVVRHFAQGANPTPIGQLLPLPREIGGVPTGGAGVPIPKSWGGSGWDGAIANLVKNQDVVRQRMMESYRKGDKVSTGMHALAWAMPLIGPILDQAGEEAKSGHMAAMLGDVLGITLGPKAQELGIRGAVKTAQAVRHPSTLLPRLPDNPNPVERAASEWGQNRGIPVDAGTATGNPWVRAMTQVVDASPVGAWIGMRAKQKAAAALTKVGGEIADTVHPTPVSRVEAGSGLVASTKALYDNVKAQIKERYGVVDQASAHPDNLRMVPNKPTRAQQMRMRQRMRETLGGQQLPSPAELQEMRRILVEMENWQYTDRTWNEVPDKSGNAGDYEIVAGSGGAPVYHDINNNYAPGTARMTRAEIQASISDALTTGRFTNGAKGALEVARRRLAGDTSVSKSYLGPEAGLEPVRRTAMQAPVAIIHAKPKIKPYYERLRREAEMTPAAVMGVKAKALNAMDRLMNGPDYVPLSLADEALGDIKELARQDGGYAKLIVTALEPEVQVAAKRAGPEVWQALQQGRELVKQKIEIEAHLQELEGTGGPAQAYAKATTNNDFPLPWLQKIQNIAPEMLPKVARAWLDHALHRATDDGGFQLAATLDAEWGRLGPESKKLLFPNGQAAELDQFFLLAKKLAERTNKSETAIVGSGAIGETVLVVTSPLTGVPIVVTTGILSSLLHHPAAVRAMTMGMRIATQPGAATNAALRATAYQRIATALRMAGVEGTPAMPTAKDSDQPAPTQAR